MRAPTEMAVLLGSRPPQTPGRVADEPLPTGQEVLPLTVGVQQ